MTESSVQEQRRLDLRKKRALNIFELVTEFPAASKVLLGEAVPPPNIAEELYGLSAGELLWFLQNGAEVDLTSAREAVASSAVRAVTAEYTVDKLTITYKPRYFLLAGTTDKEAKVLVLYMATNAAFLPGVIIKDQFSASRQMDA